MYPEPDELVEELLSCHKCGDDERLVELVESVDNTSTLLKRMDDSKMLLPVDKYNIIRKYLNIKNNT